MQGKVRRGLRVGLAAAIAMTVVLVSAVGGGARIADGTITSTVSIGNATGAVVEGQSATLPDHDRPGGDRRLSRAVDDERGNNGSFDVHTGDTTEPEHLRADELQLDPGRRPVVHRHAADADRHPGRLRAPTRRTGGIGTATGTGAIVDDDWQIGSIATAPGNASVPESGGDDRLHCVAGFGQRARDPRDHRRLRGRRRLRPERPRLHRVEPGRGGLRDAYVRPGLEQRRRAGQGQE